MMCKDEIVLASVATTRNRNGYPQPSVQLTEVFADIQSAKRQEFYDAMRSGIAVEISIKVRSADYSGQKYIKADGRWYQLVRDFRVEDWTELNCKEVKALAEWMKEESEGDDERDPDCVL